MIGVRAALNLHQRLVTRMEGVIEDDGTVTPVSEAEAILSTQEECGECRQPWPCRTVVLLTAHLGGEVER